MVFADRTFVEAKADLIHSILTVRVFLSVELLLREKSFSGPYSVGMRENTDQKNSEYGHFSRSVRLTENHFQNLLTLSCIMLKNDQTYLKNLAV